MMPPAGRAAPPEALQHGLDDLVQAQPAGQVQLGGEPDLGVDHAVGGQVLGALGGHPDQRLAGLHDPDGVLERLQVQLQRAASADLAHPRGQLARRRSRAAPRSRSRRPAPRWSPAAARRRGGRAAAPWGRPGSPPGSQPWRPLSQTSRRRAGRPIRSRTTGGRGSGGSSPISMAPSRAASARAEPAGLVGPQLQHGLARATGSPGLARHRTPAAALTGSSLRARPAPSRQAATPTARASSRRT